VVAVATAAILTVAPSELLRCGAVTTRCTQSEFSGTGVEKWSFYSLSQGQGWVENSGKVLGMQYIENGALIGGSNWINVLMMHVLNMGEYWNVCSTYVSTAKYVRNSCLVRTEFKLTLADQRCI
jgi:hypothetical protein